MEKKNKTNLLSSSLKSMPLYFVISSISLPSVGMRVISSIEKEWMMPSKIMKKPSNSFARTTTKLIF